MKNLLDKKFLADWKQKKEWVSELKVRPVKMIQLELIKKIEIKKK